MLEKKRDWFIGQNLFDTYPQIKDEWREIIRQVADTRETYIDRRGMRGASHLPVKSPWWEWNVLVFPIKLSDGRDGAVMTARLIQKKK